MPFQRHQHTTNPPRGGVGVVIIAGIRQVIPWFLQDILLADVTGATAVHTCISLHVTVTSHSSRRGPWPYVKTCLITAEDSVRKRHGRLTGDMRFLLVKIATGCAQHARSFRE